MTHTMPMPLVPHAMDGGGVRTARWAWYVLLSAALHLALFAILPFAAPPGLPWLARRLEVRLDAASPPLPQLAAPLVPGARAGGTPARAAPGSPPDAAHVPGAAALRLAPADAAAREVLPAAGVLLGIARQIAAESGVPAGAQVAAAYGGGASASERFARVLARPAAGERELENGVVRITTANGTVYCIVEPPRFMQNGVTPPMAVPATCP